MIVALVALVLSTTGVADAARRAVVTIFAGHAVSATPHAGGVLLLGKNRKFPSSAIPVVADAKKVEAGPRRRSRAAVRRKPSTSAPGAWKAPRIR